MGSLMKWVYGVIFVLGGSQVAFAEGTITGGGGITITCYTPTGEIDTVRLLDLAEAGDSVPESDAPPEQQFDEAMQRLRRAGKGAIARSIETTWKRLEERMIFPAGGMGLSFFDDAHDRLEPGSDCYRRQMAVYQRVTDELQVNHALLAKLSPTGVAAFRLHEAIYALSGDKNSIRTRAMVRALLKPNLSPEGLAATSVMIVPTRKMKIAEQFSQLAGPPKDPVQSFILKTADLIQGQYLLAHEVGECNLEWEIRANRKWIEIDGEKFGIDDEIEYEICNPAFGCVSDENSAVQKKGFVRLEREHDGVQVGTDYTDVYDLSVTSDGALRLVFKPGFEGDQDQVATCTYYRSSSSAQSP